MLAEIPVFMTATDIFTITKYIDSVPFLGKKKEKKKETFPLLFLIDPELIREISNLSLVI